MIKIRTLKDIDEVSWDEYVTNHVKGNYCQLASWHRIIRKTYGHEPHFLVALKESSTISAKKYISGVLPLIHFKHFIFGSRLVSMPFVDLGGLLSDDVATARCLLDKALEIAKGVGANTVELRQSNKLHVIEPINGSLPIELVVPKKQTDREIQEDLVMRCNWNEVGNKVRMVLQLPENSITLMKSFKSKLRSQIKKTIKQGLCYKVGGKELLDDFYKVFCQNMKDLGSPVHSWQLMANVLSEFGNRVAITVVYHAKIPLAAGITIGFKKIVSNPWASSLKQYKRMAPNMMLYWAMLEHACDQGYSAFDFGRSTPGEGTYNFKAQWGANPEALFWYEYGKKTSEVSYRNKLGVVNRELAQNIWKKMPLKSANWVGPKLRRFIPL